jgi:hypothetical protein
MLTTEIFHEWSPSYQIRRMIPTENFEKNVVEFVLWPESTKVLAIKEIWRSVKLAIRSLSRKSVVKGGVG